MIKKWEIKNRIRKEGLGREDKRCQYRNEEKDRRGILVKERRIENELIIREKWATGRRKQGGNRKGE